MSSVPYLIIKKKCEQVFKGKYQIYDEDVIYDAMTSIICQYAKSSTKIENLNAWLVGAIHHHFCSYVANKQKKRVFTFDNFLMFERGEDMFLESKIDAKVVADHISKLSSPYKEILTMRLLKDHSHKEIAQEMEINEATVRKYYSRSIKKLANLFISVSQIMLISYYIF